MLIFDLFIADELERLRGPWILAYAEVDGKSASEKAIKKDELQPTSSRASLLDARLPERLR